MSATREIWKFVLEIDNIVTISMPKDAKVLCVQTQREVPCIWAVVDPSAEVEQRKFYVRGTGHPLGKALPSKYIGTFQIENGYLVFHVFEA